MLQGASKNSEFAQMQDAEKILVSAKEPLIKSVRGDNQRLG
jgi:hypothetical protein